MKNIDDKSGSPKGKSNQDKENKVPDSLMYPPSEDIYNQFQKEIEIDPEDITKKKDPVEINNVRELNEKNFEVMTSVVKTAVDKGVGQMQFNVTTIETLKAAQHEPAKYNNLTVRVSGYSQRFVLLDKKLQNHIIARTKHKVL